MHGPPSCCSVREREEPVCCALCSWQPCLVPLQRQVCQHRGVRSEGKEPRLGNEQEKPTDQAGKRQLVTGELEVAGHTGRARLRALGRCENLDLKGHMELSHKITQSK